MKEATRYYCGICNRVFNTPEAAEKCESVGVEELRVKVGDYVYLLPNGQRPQRGSYGNRLFGRPRSKPILGKVIGIHGPVNQNMTISEITDDYRIGKVIPVPHTYWIWVSTQSLFKDWENAVLPESEARWDIPRYQQDCIYIPAQRD